MNVHSALRPRCHERIFDTVSASLTKMTKRFRVVVASPGEVSVERNLVDSEATAFNEYMEAVDEDIRIDVCRWERDVGAGMHVDGPQGKVNEDLRPADCDILIGIFWRYFGQKTVNARTPTEDEIRQAMDSWRRTGRPKIVLYFKMSGDLPQTRTEAEQLLWVRTFQEEFKTTHGIIRDYHNEREFTDSLRKDLLRICVKERVQPEVSEQSSPLTLEVKSQPTLLRSSGVAELVTDLTLTFTGNVLTGRGPGDGRFDLILLTSQRINITSPILDSAQSSASLTRWDGSAEYLVAFAKPVAGNALCFEDISFGLSSSGHTSTFHVRNVRVNASQMGVPAGERSQVSGLVMLRDRASGETILAEDAILGVVCGAPVSFLCEPGAPGDPLPFTRLPHESSLPAPNTTSVVKLPCVNVLRFQELMDGAFKTRDEEDGAKVPGTESAGCATNGTRFLVRFSDVPRDIRVYVAQGSSGSKALLVESDPNGSGGGVIPLEVAPRLVALETLLPLVEVKIHGGVGQAVWEWLEPRDSGSSRREACFGVALVRCGELTNGTISVNGALAPLSTVSGVSGKIVFEGGAAVLHERGGPVKFKFLPDPHLAVPRFIDNAMGTNAVRIVNTRTRLLFSFVTNQGGFDTSINVSNISQSPGGEQVQTGTCIINFYGYEGDSRVAHSYYSPCLTGGEHFVWSLSKGGAVTATPGFQGYVIAECDFPARGFAFISDVGVEKVAAGYVAEVIEETVRRNDE